MKISNLINQLKAIQLEYGDLDYAKVLHTYMVKDGVAYFDVSFTEPNIKVIDNPCGDGQILMIEED